MRTLLFIILFFSLPVSAETVPIKVGFNLFKCVIHDGEASCISPPIEFQDVDLDITNDEGYYEETYSRDGFGFDYSIRVTQYFNQSTNQKNYLIYLNLYAYVEGDKVNGTLSSASISTVDFKTLNQVEVDGSVVVKDNIRALPFFGIAPGNKNISKSNIRKKMRLKKLL